MSYRTLWCHFLSVSALFLLCGCALFQSSSYRAVQYFDLGTPPERSGAAVEFSPGVLRNDTAARGKLLYTRGIKVEFDDYNQFVQSPDALLRQYLERYFAGGKSVDAPKKLSIRGSIFLFRFDTEKQVAELGVTFRVNMNGRSFDFTRRCVAGAKTNSAEGYARAMGECTAELVHSLEKQLQK